MMTDGVTVSSSNRITLLGEPLDIRATAHAFANVHRPLLLLLLFSALLDLASTIAFMTAIGPGAEANPVVRVLSYQLGIMAGPAIGKLFQLFAAFALAAITPRLTRFVVATVILMNLFAFVVNMHVFVLGR